MGLKFYKGYKFSTTKEQRAKLMFLGVHSLWVDTSRFNPDHPQISALNKNKNGYAWLINSETASTDVSASLDLNDVIEHIAARDYKPSNFRWRKPIPDGLLRVDK